MYHAVLITVDCSIVGSLGMVIPSALFFFLKIVFGFFYVENSERDGHIRPPDLPLEKPICRKQQLELDM